MWVVMVEDVRPLQPVGEHEGFVIQYPLSGAFGHDLPPVQHDDPRA